MAAEVNLNASPDLKKAVVRLLEDITFRDVALADPESAVALFDLDTEERKALRTFLLHRGWLEEIGLEFW